MNTTCSNRLIKHIMFGFNFIFVITGIIILGVGASVKAHYYPYDAFLDAKYFSLPNMLIATGSLIFLISFLGCYGAMRENWILLITFSALLSIIFIFELSVGIAGYVLRDKTSSYLDAKLHDTMLKYTTSPAIDSMWDILQEKFKCCGVSNYSDWYVPFNNNSLPMSCCPLPSGIVGVFYCNTFISVTTEVTTVETQSEITSPATTQSDITTSATTPTEITTQATESTTPTMTQTEITSSSLSETAAQKVLSTSETSANLLLNLMYNNNITYPPSSSEPYTTGCHAAFGNFVKKHAVDIGAVGIVLAVIQVSFYYCFSDIFSNIQTDCFRIIGKITNIVNCYLKWKSMI